MSEDLTTEIFFEHTDQHEGHQTNFFGSDQHGEPELSFEMAHFGSDTNNDGTYIFWCTSQESNENMEDVVVDEQLFTLTEDQMHEFFNTSDELKETCPSENTVDQDLNIQTDHEEIEGHDQVGLPQVEFDASDAMEDLGSDSVFDIMIRSRGNKQAQAAQPVAHTETSTGHGVAQADFMI